MSGYYVRLDVYSHVSQGIHRLYQHQTGTQTTVGQTSATSQPLCDDPRQTDRQTDTDNITTDRPPT